MELLRPTLKAKACTVCGTWETFRFGVSIGTSLTPPDRSFQQPTPATRTRLGRLSGTDSRREGCRIARFEAVSEVVGNGTARCRGSARP
jgi:hypothetical protein